MNIMYARKRNVQCSRLRLSESNVQACLSIAEREQTRGAASMFNELSVRVINNVQ